ncbi:hypothetical protein C8Q76DRAFT_738710 [Earliella scabrosa]|nr:hypothetical protein C8Q76DRAFT_738710 [Earliella scabrosa]
MREAAQRRREAEIKQLQNELDAARRDLDAARQSTRDLEWHLRGVLRESDERIQYLKNEHALSLRLADQAQRRVDLIQAEFDRYKYQQYSFVQDLQTQLQLAHTIRDQLMCELQALRDRETARQREEFEAQQRAAHEQAEMRKREQERRDQEEREERERKVREEEEQKKREEEEREKREREERAARDEQIRIWDQLFCTEYDRRWQLIKEAKPEYWGAVPYMEFPFPVIPTIRTENWPAPPAPSDIDKKRVEEFLFHPVRMEGKTRKERIREEFLRWHPDKFEGQAMRVVRNEEKEIMREAVGVIARILTEIKEGQA